jgi:hypothetical protein
MNVFTPITSPSALTSGPPEFPRLIAASVWIMSRKTRPSCTGEVPPDGR